MGRRHLWVRGVNQCALTPYIRGPWVVTPVRSDSPDGRHAGPGPTPAAPRASALHRPHDHHRAKCARLRTAHSLGHRGACAEELPWGGGRTPKRSSSICACAGRAEAPTWGGVVRRYVTGRAPGAYARTHARTYVQGASAEFRPLGVDAEKGEGRRCPFWRRRRVGVCEESPTVAAEGRRYGSHAGPNAAGRRAREPLSLRGGPRRGRVRVRAAPSAP